MAFLLRLAPASRERGTSMRVDAARACLAMGRGGNRSAARAWPISTEVRVRRRLRMQKAATGRPSTSATSISCALLDTMERCDWRSDQVLRRNDLTAMADQMMHCSTASRYYSGRAPKNDAGTNDGTQARCRRQALRAIVLLRGKAA